MTASPITFILPNKEKLEFVLSIDRIFSVTNANLRTCFFNHEYHVSSNVDIQTLTDFLYHWNNNTHPIVNASNILQYFQLFKEFEYLENYEELYQDNVRQSYIKLLQERKNEDNSMIEREVSHHLDVYLTEEYSEDFGHIPLNSLYNIFNNNERILEDHDKAYQFIINAALNINNNLFVLLKSIDASKFKDNENKKDAFKNMENRFGFAPQNLGLVDPEIEEQLEKYKKENEELTQKLEEVEKKKEISFFF